MHGEAVYFLTKRRGVPHPAAADDAEPRQLDRLGLPARPLARRTGGGGRRAILPETDAQKLLVADGRVDGIRTGDKGRGRDGKELANFEPGSDLAARVTVLAEGTQGYLTDAAISRFGLEGEQPQVWALGVKEVWKVAKPLHKIVHTMGWPLRKSAKYGEFGGSFIYPMGEEMVSLGFVAGLEYRDVAFSVHDLLQEFKTHRLVRKILRAANGSPGARRRSPRAASTRCRSASTRRACSSPARARDS